MKRKIINYVISLTLTIILFIVGIIGILIFPEFLQTFGINLNSLPKVLLYKIHHWFGLLLMIVVSIHVKLYWKWIVGMIERSYGKIKVKKSISQRKLTNFLISLSLFIPYILVIITGIIKFPGFLPFLGLSPINVPLNEISIIHDWSGIIAVFLSIIHLLLNRKWLISTTKTIIQSIKKSRIRKERAIIAVAIILATIITLFNLPNPGSQGIIDITIFDTSEESISINGIGSFTYDPNNISTLREDIFQENHFSIFDILVYLHNTHQIDMAYHFDETINMYIIDSINSINNWWYEAYYDGGWPENNNFRIDHYPYKSEMTIKLFQTNSSEINTIHDIFRDEVERKDQNNGKLIIPTVIIRGTKETLTFSNIEVTPHNLRDDVFQKGVITAIDVIMTLGELDLISYKLKWYDSIGSAEEVRNYWVEKINDDKAIGRCGFVYEAGSYQFRGFRGNHIHIPADIRVLNSPEYEEWFWICL